MPSNLVTCCKKCNNKKGDRTPEQAKMVLRISPTLLKVKLDQVSLYNWAEKNPNWKPYLYLEGSGEEGLHGFEV